MGKFIDLKGKKFGRLTVVEYSGKTARRISLWKCICECGTEKIIHGSALSNGHTKSCGCLQKEQAANAQIKHGLSKRSGISPTYRIWKLMKSRCTNPNVPEYKHYGGRGILVCDSWMESFDNFIADMGERPKGMSLDRINVNGYYEPSNCRWATNSQQANNKRTCRYITKDNETKTAKEWSDLLDIPYETIIYRLNNNYPTKDVLSQVYTRIKTSAPC